MRIVYKFRSSRLEVLYKKHLFWKFRKVFTKTPVVGPVLIKLQDLKLYGLQRNCFTGNFPKSKEQSIHYLWTAASVISLYLHRYLQIFPIHFLLNHRKSYSCSQVYITIGIYYITLLLLLCFTCRLEIM